MNQQPVVQEASESAGHVVLGKMKAKRQYSCLQTHAQLNTKGKPPSTIKIISDGSTRKKVFKIARKKLSLEMSRLRRGKFLIHFAIRKEKNVTAIKIA